MVRLTEDASDAKSAVETLARQLFTSDELQNSSVTGFQCNKDYKSRPGLSPSRRGILESELICLYAYNMYFVSACFHMLTVPDKKNRSRGLPAAKSPSSLLPVKSNIEIRAVIKDPNLQHLLRLSQLDVTGEDRH